MNETLVALLILMAILILGVLLLVKRFFKDRNNFLADYRKDILAKVDELIPDYIYDEPLTDEDVEKIVDECTLFLINILNNSPTVKKYFDKNPSKLKDAIRTIVKIEEIRLKQEMGIEDKDKPPEPKKLE